MLEFYLRLQKAKDFKSVSTWKLWFFELQWLFWIRILNSVKSVEEQKLRGGCCFGRQQSTRRNLRLCPRTRPRGETSRRCRAGPRPWLPREQQVGCVCLSALKGVDMWVFSVGPSAGLCGDRGGCSLVVWESRGCPDWHLEVQRSNTPVSLADGNVGTTAQPQTQNLPLVQEWFALVCFVGLFSGGPLRSPGSVSSVFLLS